MSMVMGEDMAGCWATHHSCCLQDLLVQPKQLVLILGCNAVTYESGTLLLACNWLMRHP